MNAMMFFLGAAPCYQDCKHCYAKSPTEVNRPKDLSEIKAILDKLAETNQGLYKDYKISITLNDDPFTHKNIMEILEYIKLKKLYIPRWIITNGYALARRKNITEILAKFKEMGTVGIVLSLFGYEKNHDQFVGLKGSYANLMKAIEIIQENELDYAINLFLTAFNLEDVISLKEKYKGKVNLALFGSAARLENEENKKYWAKYQDLLATNIDQDPQAFEKSYGSIYFSVSKIREKIIDDDVLIQNGTMVLDTPNFIVENNNDIYFSAHIHSLYKVGDLNFDSIEDLKNRISIFDYLYQEFYENKPDKLREMILKWTDENDDRIFYIMDLISYCFRKEIKGDLFNYWLKLPAEKIRIGLEHKINYSYNSKLNIGKFKSKTESFEIGGKWTNLIAQLLQGENSSSILKSEGAKEEFLKLIFELQQKGFIWVCLLKTIARDS